MRLEQIDANFQTAAPESVGGIRFHNVCQPPFQIYGLMNCPQLPGFTRMPPEAARAVSENVAHLARHTAGGRVRFSTNSRRIAIRCRMKEVTRLPHMALAGTSGFDLYQSCAGRDIYVGSFLPPVETENGFEAAIDLQAGAEPDGIRAYTIHFPLYNDVLELEIGLQTGSALEPGQAYRDMAPVVYYGSSITQGGTVCRPGLAYSNIISARSNIDHVNLGFSGSARGEQAMADYIARLRMSMLVMDYDHNAPDAQWLQNTHAKFFETIRAAQPNLPVLMVSMPNTRFHDDDGAQRRDIVYSTYRSACGRGDRAAFFLDGSCLFDSSCRDLCTVDGVHPNDLGHACMAKGIGAEIRRILHQEIW